MRCWRHAGGTGDRTSLQSVRLSDRRDLGDGAAVGRAGPFAQAVAGVDIALWDLFARRQKQPPWKPLGGTLGRMRVNASGINPDGCVAAAEAAMRRGVRAFKLKIGFDRERDRENLRDLRQSIGELKFAVDVNQGWSLGQALDEPPKPDAAKWGASPAASPLRARQPGRDPAIARIPSVAASGFSLPRICSPPAVAAGSKSIATTILCAITLRQCCRHWRWRDRAI